MNNSKRFVGGIMAAIGGIALVVALLWALSDFPDRANPVATSTSITTGIPIQTAASSTDSTSDQIAAEVNGEIITLEEWRQTTALEQALNTLAGQPPSAAEVVLERLVNERIALQASRATPTPEAAGEAGAEARLQALMQTWGVNEADLNAALTQAGVTRRQLLDEISRLLVVENILLGNGGQEGAQSWLKARREQARVSIFSNLNDPAAGVSDVSATAPTPEGSPTQEAPANSSTPVPTSAATPVAQQNNPPSNIENISSGPNEGQLAPDFTLQLATGGSITLSELRGRPVVLNFWATWCPVCRRELPALQAAAREWSPQGVTLVSVDLREDAATVTAFAAANNLTYTVALDSDGAIAQNYQVLGIPTTLFIDADGVVRSRFIGPLTEEIFAERVTPLLPSKATVEGAPAVTLAETSSSSEISVFPGSPYDFTLDDQTGNPFTLSAALEEQKLVLVFYRGKT